MRKVLIALAASMAVASPALANEGRIEARGGIFWTDGYSHATAGAAAGYDFDLGQKAFAGVEVSADKVLDSGTKTAFGFSGRLGAKAGEKTKIFVDGGYTTEPCSGCDGAAHAGVGIEQGFGHNLYGKLGYRHYFPSGQDFNAAVVGLGVRF